MAVSANITRRSALKAIPAAGLAAIVPSAAIALNLEQNTSAVRALISDHREAYIALETASDGIDAVALGRRPSRAAERRWSKAENREYEAKMALCSYRAGSDEERSLKAAYLIEHERLNWHEAEEYRAVLQSMVDTRQQQQQKVEPADADLIRLGEEFEAAWTVEEAERQKGIANDGWSGWDAAYDHTYAIVKRIEPLEAKTLAGFRVKARCIQWCYGDDPAFHDSERYTTDLRIAQSIVKDLLRSVS